MVKKKLIFSNLFYDMESFFSLCIGGNAPNTLAVPEIFNCLRLLIFVPLKAFPCYSSNKNNIYSYVEKYT